MHVLDPYVLKASTKGTSAKGGNVMLSPYRTGSAKHLNNYNGILCGACPVLDMGLRMTGGFCRGSYSWLQNSSTDYKRKQRGLFKKSALFFIVLFSV